MEGHAPKSGPQLGGPPRLRFSWLPEPLHVLIFRRPDWLMILLPIGLFILVGWRTYGTVPFALQYFGTLAFGCLLVGPKTFPSRAEIGLTYRQLRHAQPCTSAATFASRRGDWLQVLQEPMLRSVRDTGVMWNVRWHWLSIRLLFAVLVWCLFMLSPLSVSAQMSNAGLILILLLVSYFVCYRVARRRMLVRLRSALSTPACPRCNYDLSSYIPISQQSEPRRCPECGCPHPLAPPPIAPNWKNWLTSQST